MKDAILGHFNGQWEMFYGRYLQQIKPAGGSEYKAPCPFHDDADPSLSLNGETGRYYCHGCGKKGDGLHFYAKINSLDTRRDFARILRGIASDFNIPVETKKSKIVKTYEYVDAKGKQLFQVCRMEPKDFRQRHKASGKWVWNLKGVERVLYRLPEVMQADEVLIVEGEKDCDNLSQLGFTATTCPMGAGKWRDEYGEALKGKHVVLVPDNDNQGKEHMAKVGACLNGHAASLKLLELPDLPSKGDVSDFIAHFSDTDEAAERLSTLIEGASPYKPPKIASLDDAVLLAAEFAALELPPRRTFLHPWLTEQSITLASGWRGTGKTYFALSVLHAVATGGLYGPWEAEAPVSALYLDGEMVPSDLQDRIAELGINVNDCPFYIYSDAFSNTLGLPRANLLSEKWRKSMHRILVTRKIKVWVLDNLVSCSPGIDENSQREWSPINDWLLELRFKGISTIMLHHTGKGGTQRGTSGREDNIDTSIILKRPFDYSNEDGCRFICHFGKNRVRQRDLPLVADTEFQLMVDDAGAATWAWRGVKKQARSEVLKMIDEGIKQADIATALNINRSTVTRIRKTAIAAGHLTEKNKLTYEGASVVSG